MKAAEGVPRCSCGGIIKPDVVLYEEGLNDRTINESVRAISQAQVLIIGGTSLAVYPAAGLIIPPQEHLGTPSAAFIYLKS